jgi:hypothetical protein
MHNYINTNKSILFTLSKKILGLAIQLSNVLTNISILMYYPPVVHLIYDKSELCNKAHKVSFKLYKDIKSTDPLIKTLLHLLDHKI